MNGVGMSILKTGMGIFKPPTGRRIRGHLRIVSRAAGGGDIELRSAHNLVVRGGARMVAALMVGEAGAEPINRIRLGFARESADAESSTLTAADPVIDDAMLESAIAPESFTVNDTLDGVVRIAIAAEFEPAIDLEEVSEAGLFAGARLYNQVVFEPVSLRQGQRVTFFWDIEIPFGD